MVLLGAVMLVCAVAHAAAADTRVYTFSCQSPALKLQLISFKFSTDVTFSGTGSGASASKPAYALTLRFPANADYLPVQEDIFDGRVFASCTLTATLPGASEEWKWSLGDVVFSEVSMVGDPSISERTDETPMYVQASLVFDKVTVTSTTN
jgi:hypothetical protein